MVKRRPDLVAALAGCIAILIFLGVVALNLEFPPLMDFWSYYHAALAWQRGLDPYKYFNLLEVATTPFTPVPETPFLYHPVVLLLFTLFTAVPFGISSAVFAGILALALLALIVLWFNTLIPVLSTFKSFLFLCLLIFGFDFALAVALVSGNVSIIESLLVWIALAALVKENPNRFVAVILVSAIFKVLPLIFLPLIFLVPVTSGTLRRSGLFLIVFALIWSSPVLWAPDLMQSYLTAATSRFELGRLNPCTLAFSVDLMGGDGKGFLLYCALAAAVGLVTIWRIRRTYVSADKVMRLCVAIFACALIAPRFKNYSYVLLVPPALLASNRAWPLWIINIIGFGLIARVIGIEDSLIGTYSAWVALALNWVITLSQLPSQKSVSERASI